MIDEKTQKKIDLMLAKRKPDALMVLMQLVRAGLRKGSCSGNDVVNRNLTESNVIGGVFSTLKTLGFIQTDRREVGIHESMHRRKVHIWELLEPFKARYFIDKCAGMAFGGEMDKYTQLEIF